MITQITSEHLIIKEIDYDNDQTFKEIVGWLNNPLVVRFSEQRHHRHTVETQKDYISHMICEGVYRVIYYEDKLIGTISAHLDDHNRVANVGIMIGDHSKWGLGLGHEAWNVFCDALLKTNIRKIEAGCMICNRSMMNICSKYGMMEEALLEDHFLYHEVPMSLVMWGKLK